MVCDKGQTSFFININKNTSPLKNHNVSDWTSIFLHFYLYVHKMLFYGMYGSVLNETLVDLIYKYLFNMVTTSIHGIYYELIWTIYKFRSPTKDLKQSAVSYSF